VLKGGKKKAPLGELFFLMVFLMARHSSVSQNFYYLSFAGRVILAAFQLYRLTLRQQSMDH